MADEVYNDASIPHGSAVITITETAVAYDCDSFRPAASATKTTKRYKPNGAKGGSFGTNDFLEGSAQVQIPTSATALPVGGQHFTADKTDAKVWIIQNVSPAYEKDNYLVCDITFIEQLNG